MSFKIGDKVVRKPEHMHGFENDFAAGKPYLVLDIDIATDNLKVMDNKGWALWWDIRRFEIYKRPVKINLV